MRYIVVRHRIKDYAQWKPVFDESEELRRQAGLGGGRIERDINDPNLLTIILRTEDVDRATEFMNSKEVREAIKRAGVVGELDILFTEDVEEVPEPVAHR